MAIEGPVHVPGTVLTVRRLDAYTAMTLVAPSIAEKFRPGQFLAVAVGDGPALQARRAFFISDVSADHGGTLEFVFEASGAGTTWLAGRRSRDILDVIGPVGRPFPLPRDTVTSVLIGHGQFAAPMIALATALKRRDQRVHLVLTGASADRVFGAITARRIADGATVITQDGTLGVRGTLDKTLPGLLTDIRADVVYACGPMAELRYVCALAARRALPVQVALTTPMACGIGMCMGCVVPVTADDGVTRMTRVCTDGPVFRGERVRFDDIDTISLDALGAPRAALGRPGR